MALINRNWLYLLSGLILISLMWYFSDVVAYVLIAWVVSLLGRPIMHFYLNRIKIGRYRIGNTVASLLTIFTILALLLGIIAAFVPTLVHQANNFATLDYQALGEKLQGPFSWLDLQAHRFGVIKPGTSLATEIQTALLQWFQPSMVSDIVGGVFATAGGIVVTISAVSFILFFFLQEQGLFSEIIHAIVPTEYEPKVLTAIDDSSEALTGYFRGLITQLASFSMMASVFLWILGVPYALLIGVAGGLLNIVPYVGPIIGLVFGCFIVLSSHLDLELVVIGTLMLKVCAAFLVTQAIDNLFLSTLIFSKSVKAHPLEIFIVTLMAAKIGGVAGMILGIPVYTVLRVIARTFFRRFKVVQRLTDHLDEPD